MNIRTTTTVRGVVPSKKVSTTVKESAYKARKGLNFPFPVNGSAYVNKSVEVELAKANLKQLLNTAPGERLMLPNFGCNLESLLFEPFDERLVLEVKERVSFSISNYIPYLTLNRVRVERVGDRGRYGLPTLVIKVFCQIRDDENTIFEVGVKL